MAPDCGPGLEPPTPAPGPLARAVARAKARTASAAAWVTGARTTHASVDVGFRFADRDRQVAAAVLAAGVAYRLFFWSLSLALLLAGGLGFVDAQRVESALQDNGMARALSQAIGEAAGASQAGRWWFLAVGVWLALWTGYMGAKTLVLVHAAVWGVRAPRVASPWRASLAFSGGLVGVLAASAMARWLRGETEVLGIVVTLAVLVVPFVGWLWASWVLPHRDARWIDLMPGALLVATGMQALHLFVAFFLGPKLASQTQLYGGVGIATTALFALYLVGRLVAAAANLNASLYERREGPSAGS